ncbi:MAG TPA: endo-1,4-beta-xylanase [Acidobacteriaceae bacterium]|jgi:endo-1,4-beta-xylanase
MPTRRDILQSGFGLAIASAIPAKLFAANTNLPLKQLAAHTGIAVGAQATRTELLRDQSIAGFIAQNFNVLTPGIELKWERIRPAPNTFFFNDGDWMVNFAHSHGMQVHGHNLCWNNYNPAWMAKTITKDNAERFLTDHITKVVGHYRGRIASWDVVNEPVRSQQGRPDGLSTGLWMDTLGPRYIDIAFAAARAADPSAKLIMNLDAIEQDVGREPDNRQHALTLIKQMQQRKTPIDGIGSEAHLDGNSNVKSQGALQFYQAVHSLGLSVALSELDIDDTSETGNDAARKARNGNVYATFITWIGSSVPLTRLSFWTISDEHNGLDDGAVTNVHLRRKDGAQHYPGLLSTSDAPNPAWASVCAAIAALPQRS